MPRGQVAVAAALGGLPPAVVYAVIGAAATRLDGGLLVVAAVLGLAALAWVATRHRPPPLRPAAKGG